MPPEATGFVLAADADYCGSGSTTITTTTIANPLDFSFYTSVWIEFDNDWRTISSNDEAYIEVSNDSGVTWVTVAAWLGVDERDTHEVIDITSVAAFHDNVLIRLRTIQPGWDWWWAVDNFAVYAISYGYPPPNAPSNLVAVANAPGQVLLNWQDNSNDEIRFDMYRKLGDSLSTENYQWIGFTGTNVTTYIDTTVLDTTLYTYRVSAYDGYFSSHSNQAEVMTLIPVELTSFKGIVLDENVKLNWATATETNNSGFEIYRTHQRDKQNWKKIGFVQGHGTTTKPQSYSFMDELVPSGSYQYKLKQIDYDGTYEYSNVIDIEIKAPAVYSLCQNYPNPFNPATNIKYQIANDGFVNLTVYNSLGEKVAVLVNEQKPAGSYNITFNASNLPSGIYVYRLKSGNFIQSKKMLLLK